MPRPTAAELHAALLDSDSATAVLERLCGGPIRIRRLASPAPPPLPTALHGRVTHRRVMLLCGDRPVSEADLWFLPDALSADMARALAQTDTPFGRVVQPLALRRHLLAARVLAAALEHRALLRTPAGAPVAEVWERYGPELVAG